MAFLLQDHLKLLLLFLGNQIKVELLVGEHDLNLRQVLQVLGQLRLHLRESSRAKYVLCQCSCGPAATLREVRVPKPFWRVA